MTTVIPYFNYYHWVDEGADRVFNSPEGFPQHSKLYLNLNLTSTSVVTDIKCSFQILSI